VEPDPLKPSSNGSIVAGAMGRVVSTRLDPSGAIARISVPFEVWAP
jgi:hypothetical protein